MLPFVLVIIADVSKGCVVADFDVTFYSNERPSKVINGPFLSRDEVSTQTVNLSLSKRNKTFSKIKDIRVRYNLTM